MGLGELIRDGIDEDDDPRECGICGEQLSEGESLADHLHKRCNK